MPNADTVVFAIADQNGAVAIHEDAVGASQSAGLWAISIWTISPLTVANQNVQDTCFHIDITDGVRFGVSEINHPVLTEANALGPRQVCIQGWATIALESRLARACNPFDLILPGIQDQHRVSLSQRQVPESIRAKYQCSWSKKGCFCDCCAIFGSAFFPSARPGKDTLCLHVHPPNPMVRDVANEQVTLGVKCKTVGLIQLRLIARASIARESGFAIAGDRSDFLGGAIDAANTVVTQFDKIEMAFFIPGYFVRLIQLSVDGRTAIAGVSFRSRARHRFHDAIVAYASYPMVFHIADVNRTIWAPGNAVDVIQGCLIRSLTISRKSFTSIASEGRYLLAASNSCGKEYDPDAQDVSHGRARRIGVLRGWTDHYIAWIQVRVTRSKVPSGAGRCDIITCVWYRFSEPQLCLKIKATDLRIAITGSSGFIGERLVAFLLARGHQIVRLVRHQPDVADSDQLYWDPVSGLETPEQLEACDALIHLAGRSIAAGRWTDAEKQRIRESRVLATEVLVSQLMGLSQPPKTFVGASAVGLYGDCAAEEVDENHPPGDDFLASVAMDWEHAAQPLKSHPSAIRVAHARLGVVLDPAQGAMAKMLPLFRMGVAGKLGQGTQYWSWVAVEDVVTAIAWIVEVPTANGPYNVVAPHPVSNAEFTKQLASVLRRPAMLGVPEFMLRLAVGEMADALLLTSCRAVPKRLMAEGFTFQYSDLASYLQAKFA